MSQERRSKLGHVLVVVAAAGLGATYASVLSEIGAHRGSDYGACTDGADGTVATGVDADERVTIPTEGLPHKGASANRTRVTMIECSDFQCPYSRRASKTVDELVAHNVDLAFFHVNFPLGAFEHSRLKARAAVAAQRQGRFWSMHDALFDAPIASDDDALALAERLGLDARRFARDLADPATAAEVDRQRSLCGDVGVRAVPTFFINGRRVVGSIPTDEFQQVIDEERRAARER